MSYICAYAWSLGDEINAFRFQPANGQGAEQRALEIINARAAQDDEQPKNECDLGGFSVWSFAQLIDERELLA